MYLIGIEFCNLIHVPVEHDDVRVVVGAPDVHFVEVAVFHAGAEERIAVCHPVGGAVDAIGVGRFLIGALELAPDEVFQVVFHRGDLGRIGVDHVFGGHKRRLAEGRIVASQHVAPPVVEPVGVIGPPQHLLLHVVHRIEAVVPPGAVTVLLMVDNERTALF